MKTTMSLKVNGRDTHVEVATHDRLIDLLRDNLGLTATKEGCSEGECGACTVLVDGKAVNSCLYPALEVDGRSVTTIEGLAQATDLSPVQKAFVEHGGVQCGFCTSGVQMMSVALLADNPRPSEREVREALSGNLCRCTGYVQIVESVMRAADAAGEGEGDAQ